MEAVVMELRDGKAAVLTMEGSFEKIDDKGYTVGQKLEVNESMFINASAEVIDFSKRKPKMTVAKRAMRKMQIAAAIVFIVVTGGVVSYATPCTTVSMDVNPSISLSLNIYDRVIKVDAYNDDGTEIVSAVKDDVRGHNLDYAVGEVLDALSKGNYINDSDTDFVATVSSHFQKEDRAKDMIERSVNRWNKRSFDASSDASVALEYIEPTPDIIKEAKEKNVSPGKLSIVKEAEKADTNESYSEDEWLNKSVREINEVRHPEDEVNRPSNVTNNQNDVKDSSSRIADRPQPFDRNMNYKNAYNPSNATKRNEAENDRNFVPNDRANNKINDNNSINKKNANDKADDSNNNKVDDSNNNNKTDNTNKADDSNKTNKNKNDDRNKAEDKNNTNQEDKKKADNDNKSDMTNDVDNKDENNDNRDDINNKTNADDNPANKDNGVNPDDNSNPNSNPNADTKMDPNANLDPNLNPNADPNANANPSANQANEGQMDNANGNLTLTAYSETASMDAVES